MARVLIVDNEPQIRRVVKVALIIEKLEVGDARSGEEALEQIHREKYDLVLLDINMPGLNGLETCRAIRAHFAMPIVMLTVDGAEKDKVTALDAGADDYVTKPFSMPELLARIRVALRRSSAASAVCNGRLRLESVEINFTTREVISVHGRVHLTAREFDVLSYFADHANKAIDHRELLCAVWGPDYGNEYEYLRVFVNRLRKKIESNAASPRHLLTVPWVGYRFHLPDRSSRPRNSPV